jgi:tripartite-type tricarboxylate transporter receptor subunit TctC
MQYLKSKEGNPHFMMISLSNVITTPLHTKLGFSWKDLTPLARVALDRHCLCVGPKTHPEWNSVADVVKSIKAAPKGTYKFGGTGSKQEDQIVMLMFEDKALGSVGWLTYVPFKGGGTVAANLVGGHIDLNANNPSEFLPHSRANRIKVLAMFDKDRVPGLHQMDESSPIAPTVKEQGYDVVYEMLRGVFGPPKMKADEIAYYVNVLKQIEESKEWVRYTGDQFLQRAFLDGPALTKWLTDYEALHERLLKAAGLM